MQQWSRVAGGQRRVSGGLPLTTASTAAHSGPVGRRRGIGLSVQPTTSRADQFCFIAHFSRARFWIGRRRPTRFVLLFEVGTWPPHDGFRRMGRFNLLDALAVSGLQGLRTLRTRLTHRPREDIFLPEQNSLNFLSAPLVHTACGATAVVLLLQRNSVPSTHMRCRTTARRPGDGDDGTPHAAPLSHPQAPCLQPRPFSGKDKQRLRRLVEHRAQHGVAGFGDAAIIVDFPRLRWLAKFGRRDKWNFCLTAAIMPPIRRDDDKAYPP